MRFLGRALAALFAVGVFLVAIAWFLPREVTVTREIVIAAPPARVFAHLNSLQKMAEWSPWTRLDPAMRTSFAGPPEGVGNRMTWSSDDPRGRQRQPGDHRQRARPAGRDVAPARRRWGRRRPGWRSGPRTAAPMSPGASSPTWAPRPSGRYMGLALDRWIGADFEAGPRVAEGARRARIAEPRGRRRRCARLLANEFLGGLALPLPDHRAAPGGRGAALRGDRHRARGGRPRGRAAHPHAGRARRRPPSPLHHPAPDRALRRTARTSVRMDPHPPGRGGDRRGRLPRRRHDRAEPRAR